VSYGYHRYLQGVVGGVHVLPFYPSSADRGFAPLTYKEVSPEFGNWDDIESMGDGLDLCMDFMVNHISAQSKEFQDFKEKGDKVRTVRLPSASVSVINTTA
jgi:sucrose phosphorylase